MKNTFILVSVLLLMMSLSTTHSHLLNIFKCDCNETTHIDIICRCTENENYLNRSLSIEHVFPAIKGILKQESIHQINKLELHDINSPINTQAVNIFNKDSLTQLTFTSTNLKSINKEIFNNSRLKEVSILNNIVPLELEEDNFKYIPELESLEVRNCSIYQLKNSFYNLMKLKFVDFSYNQIQEMNSNTFHTNLRLIYINMSNNMIKEIKTNTFAGLINLTTVDLKNNHLRIIRKGSFQNLKSLQTLYLDNNAISIIETGAFENSFEYAKIYLQNNYLKRINFVGSNMKTFSIKNNLLQRDCAMNDVMEHKILIQGHCLELKHLENKTINELSVKDLLCIPKLNCLLPSHDMDRKLILLTCIIHANPTATITWTANEANISPNTCTDRKEEVMWSTLTIPHSKCTNEGYRIEVSSAAGPDYFKYDIDCNAFKKSDAFGILLYIVVGGTLTVIIGTIIYVNKPKKCFRRQQNLSSESEEALSIHHKETPDGSHDNEIKSIMIDMEGQKEAGA